MGSFFPPFGDVPTLPEGRALTQFLPDRDALSAVIRNIPFSDAFFYQAILAATASLVSQSTSVVRRTGGGEDSTRFSALLYQDDQGRMLLLSEQLSSKAEVVPSLLVPSTEDRIVRPATEESRQQREPSSEGTSLQEQSPGGETAPTTPLQELSSGVVGAEHTTAPTTPLESAETEHTGTVAC